MNEFGEAFFVKFKEKIKKYLPIKKEKSEAPQEKLPPSIRIAVITFFLIISIYIGGCIGCILSPHDGFNFGFFTAIKRAITTSTGHAGTLMAFCAIGGFLLYLKFRGRSNESDDERNFTYSAKGTYGTSNLMDEERMAELFDVADYAAETDGIIIGQTEDGKVVSIPRKSPYNRNIAVCGSQGSNKSVAFARNKIIQSALRGESIFVTDPKSELFEDTVFFLYMMGYDVKQWNLIDMENSSSWDILNEIEQGKYMDVLSEVIIRNTLNGDDPDHFYDGIEKNLLKALCYYVYTTKPYGKRTLGEAYNMLITYSPDELDKIFDTLRKTDPENPAIGPYMLFSKAPASKGNAILGLGTRLGIFQDSLVRSLTGTKDIDLVAPAKKKTAIFCIVSDQDSTYDVLATLLISMMFIKVVRYADSRPNRKCDIPVNFVLDEFPNVGEVPDFKKKLATARSRDIGVDILFQNIPQMQDRYQGTQWEELLGGCDFRLFLGCNETTTSEYFAKLCGKTTVEVSSKRKTLNTLRLTDFTPQFAESNSVGQRDVMFEDEIRRLKPDEMLVIIRGELPMKLKKYGFYLHTESLNLKLIKTSEIIPEWRIKNGIDILSGQKAKTKEDLIREVEADSSRYVIKNTEKFGQQRDKLLEDLKEVNKRRATKEETAAESDDKPQQDGSDSAENEAMSEPITAKEPEKDTNVEHVQLPSDSITEGPPKEADNLPDITAFVPDDDYLKELEAYQKSEETVDFNQSNDDNQKMVPQTEKPDASKQQQNQNGIPDKPADKPKINRQSNLNRLADFMSQSEVPTDTDKGQLQLLTPITGRTQREIPDMNHTGTIMAEQTALPENAGNEPSRVILAGTGIKKEHKSRESNKKPKSAYSTTDIFNLMKNQKQ